MLLLCCSTPPFAACFAPYFPSDANYFSPLLQKIIRNNLAPKRINTIHCTRAKRSLWLTWRSAIPFLRRRDLIFLRSNGCRIRQSWCQILPSRSTSYAVRSWKHYWFLGPVFWSFDILIVGSKII